MSVCSWKYVLFVLLRFEQNFRGKICLALARCIFFSHLPVRCWSYSSSARWVYLLWWWLLHLLLLFLHSCWHCCSWWCYYCCCYHGHCCHCRHHHCCCCCYHDRIIHPRVCTTAFSAETDWKSLTLLHSYSLVRKLPVVFRFLLWMKEEGQFQSMHSRLNQAKHLVLLLFNPLACWSWPDLLFVVVQWLKQGC